MSRNKREKQSRRTKPNLSSQKYRIAKYELPKPYTIKHINLKLLIDSRSRVRNSAGESPIYELHDMTYGQMKQQILNKLKHNEISYASELDEIEEWYKTLN